MKQHPLLPAPLPALFVTAAVGLPAPASSAMVLARWPDSALGGFRRGTTRPGNSLRMVT